MLEPIGKVKNEEKQRKNNYKDVICHSCPSFFWFGFKLEQNDQDHCISTQGPKYKYDASIIQSSKGKGVYKYQVNKGNYEDFRKHLHEVDWACDPDNVDAIWNNFYDEMYVGINKFIPKKNS